MQKNTIILSSKVVFINLQGREVLYSLHKKNSYFDPRKGLLLVYMW